MNKTSNGMTTNTISKKKAIGFKKAVQKATFSIKANP
jgi:hypothetical protein